MSDQLVITYHPVVRDAAALAAAERAETRAAALESMAAWEREIGIDLSEPGQSVGDRQARQARACARALRMKAETGEHHCICHCQPERDCPSREGVKW